MNEKKSNKIKSTLSSLFQRLKTNVSPTLELKTLFAKLTAEH